MLHGIAIFVVRDWVMGTIQLIGTIIYFAILITLGGYGLHRYWMLYLYYKHRHDDIKPAGKFSTLPKITVQLPLYNEMYVAERLLDAVAALDYPKDKLEIQVLDDSTDQTTEIVERKVAALSRKGFAVTHVHRANRHGFKAGALKNGLELATGEYIAILDADFVPPADLLQKTIQYFTDPKVGMIQTRWGHLNERYSLLTRIQSILIDGHFIIEHTARSRSGRFFNFNGTAGIWRRTCIESAGGWQHDTLAEDLDLSYRAQINGWRFLFLPDIVTPAELPVEMNAFKTQQHRWAKGSIQTCKKMLPALWRSNVPLKVKVEGTIHLTSGFGYIGLLILCLSFHHTASIGTIQASSGNYMTKMMLVDLPLFLAATVSISAFYFCAQKQLHAHWWKRLLYLPLLMAVGAGLCINNARAVLEAVFNHRTDFIRTPKYGVRDHSSSRAKGHYRTLRGLIPYLEVALGLYFTWSLWEAIRCGQWSLLPFVMIFQFGFLYIGLLSIMQSDGRFTKPAVDPILNPASA